MEQVLVERFDLLLGRRHLVRSDAEFEERSAEIANEEQQAVADEPERGRGHDRAALDEPPVDLLRSRHQLPSSRRRSGPPIQCTHPL
jgi:hypothetical protein